MAIITPNISSVTFPEPPVLPPPVAPFVWQAYGTLIQDYLDGRLKDTAAYYTPIAVVKADIELERDKVFRKYHRTRKELLAVEGRKNLTLMPGHLQRKLMDLALDEKRELAEETAKIAARHGETSLDTVYGGAGLALESDGLRSEMHYKVQAASFAVAKAALMAGYELASQKVAGYEALLKGISTNFDLIKIEYKALSDAIEQDIAAVRIEILAAEQIGDAEELLKLAAEIEVTKKSVEVALSRIPIAEAELQKIYAQMGILEAERALAVFKELTAQASMAKSAARQQEAGRIEAKIDLEYEKVGLQITKDDAQTDAELSVIAARRVEEALDNMKAEMQVSNVELDAELAAIRAGIASADASTSTSMAGQVAANAGERVAAYATQISNAISRFNTLYGKLSALESYLKTSYTKWTAQYTSAGIDEREAIIAAAQSAAQADVDSTFVYSKGQGAPPPRRT